jgi:hypothetical protein
MDGVASSICAAAAPIVLARLTRSCVVDTSRSHPRGETHFAESLFRYFGHHHVEQAWPVLSRLYSESVDEYVLATTGDTLVAWGDSMPSAGRRDACSRSS